MAGEFWPGFLLALGAGVVLGAAYDSFRILHLVLGGGKGQRFLFDMLFMTVAALVTFLTALAAEAGQLRFYLLAGEGIGMCAWALTFGELTLWAASVIAAFLRWLRRLGRWLMRPIYRTIRRVMRFFCRQLGKIPKNISQKPKKSLERDGESSV